MPTRNPELKLSNEALSHMRSSWVFRGNNFAPRTTNEKLHTYATNLKRNEITNNGWQRAVKRLMIDTENIPCFWLNGAWDRAMSARQIALNDIPQQKH